jgi:hypothetical protein
MESKSGDKCVDRLPKQRSKKDLTPFSKKDLTPFLISLMLTGQRLEFIFKDIISVYQTKLYYSAGKLWQETTNPIR